MHDVFKQEVINRCQVKNSTLLIFLLFSSVFWKCYLKYLWDTRNVILCKKKKKRRQWKVSTNGITMMTNEEKYKYLQKSIIHELTEDWIAVVCINTVQQWFWWLFITALWYNVWNKIKKDMGPKISQSILCC